MSDLVKVRKILKILGNPQKDLKYVHIAGTNGKGSTAAFINNVLINGGYRTGLYTSPHIFKVNERIRVDNIDISDTEIEEYAKMFDDAIDEFNAIEQEDYQPTFFEKITCIAFMYFSYKKCDIVILETGLGGRLDPTNVIESPEVVAITTINYDHTSILGNTLHEIANEKAAIIKKDCIAICYKQSEEIIEIINGKCTEVGAEFRKIDYSNIETIKSNLSEQVFNYKRMNNIKISLLGKHQVKNASLAIEICFALRDKGFIINDGSILAGLKNTVWSGRMEIIRDKPIVIFDGAHNEEGVSTLVKNLELYFNEKKIIFLVGMLKDKDIDSSIKLTTTIAKKYVVIAPNDERAISPRDLARRIKDVFENDVYYYDDINKGIEFLMEHSNCDDVICVFGSLYLIPDIKRWYNKVYRSDDVD